MALINKYYIFAETEELDIGVDVTKHPVEKGIEITDNVKRKAVTLSVTGEIVKVGNTSAKTIRTAIVNLHKGGKLVKYQGRETISNALITSFKTTCSKDVAGGYTFDMTIKEIRIAKSAYKTSAKSTKTTKQVTSKQVTKKKTTAKTTTNTKKKYHTVKSGDCPWSIAQKYYGDGSKWEKMMKANTAIVNRNKKQGVTWYTIYVGDKLLIP